MSTASALLFGGVSHVTHALEQTCWTPVLGGPIQPGFSFSKAFTKAIRSSGEGVVYLVGQTTGLGSDEVLVLTQSSKAQLGVQLSIGVPVFLAKAGTYLIGQNTWLGPLQERVGDPAFRW